MADTKKKTKTPREKIIIRGIAAVLCISLVLPFVSCLSGSESLYVLIFTSGISEISDDAEGVQSLARLASAKNSFEAGYSGTAILDAGNAFSKGSQKNEMTAEIFDAMKYDAVNLNAEIMDYALYESLAQGSHFFSPLAANVLGSDGSYAADSYAVKKLGRLNMGIFALSAHTAAGSGLSVKNAVDSARETVEELAPKSDILILLTSLDSDTLREILSGLPQIDVVVRVRNADEEDFSFGGVAVVNMTGDDFSFGLLEVSAKGREVTDMASAVYGAPDLGNFEKDTAVAGIIEKYAD